MTARLVCVKCGRVGTRSFRLLSGTMDGTRDSWVCVNAAACARRQDTNPLPEDPR